MAQRIHLGWCNVMCVRYYNIRSRKENMNACVMAINHISGFTPQMTSDKEKKNNDIGWFVWFCVSWFCWGFSCAFCTFRAFINLFFSLGNCLLFDSNSTKFKLLWNNSVTLHFVTHWWIIYRTAPTYNLIFFFTDLQNCDNILKCFGIPSVM